MGKVRFTVAPGKPVKIEAIGYTDGSCREATRPYTDGRKVLDDVPTVPTEGVVVEERNRVGT